MSGWAPWQQPGSEWCELHLFPFADTLRRVGTFRRKFEEVKTELLVTCESPEPASGYIAMNKISQTGEIPLGDVLKSQEHMILLGEQSRSRKNTVPGSPLTLTIVRS